MSTMGEREEKLKIKCENNISFPDARELMSNFTQVKPMQVLYNQALPANPHKLMTKVHKQMTTLLNIKKINNRKRKIKVHKEKLTHLLIQEKVTHLI